MEMQAIYPFRLPRGYIDKEENLHREGQMRLATAGDELSAPCDPAVKADERRMNTLVRGKVVTALVTINEITPYVIEGLFLADMEYLQNMWGGVISVVSPWQTSTQAS